jgi:NSS family neurotransmitter:Na+ symporter
VVGVSAVISIAYTTGAGIVFLDIVDHFINNFGIVISGLLEVILFGWFFKLTSIREDNNLVSDFRVGLWWNIMIAGITPLVLLYMTYVNFRQELTVAYEGYPSHALISLGWSVVVATIVLAFLLAYGLKWKRDIQGGTTS